MKKVCDGREQEIVYTVRQETKTSPVILRACGEIMATCPGPYTAEAAGRLNENYREHRRWLGTGVTDVTLWERGEEGQSSSEE